MNSTLGNSSRTLPFMPSSQDQEKVRPRQIDDLASGRNFHSEDASEGYATQDALETEVFIARSRVER